MSLRSTVPGGVELVSCAAAWPGDGAPADARDLDAASAAERVLGSGWRELAAARGQDAEALARELGVERRGFVGRGQAAFLDLAEGAARRALAAAGVRPEDVPLVVLATNTAPRPTASAACGLAARLGAGGARGAAGAAALDVRSGGASALHALHGAALQVAAGAETALVVAVEVLGPWLSPEDLANALLFADGAAAVVLRRVDDPARGVGVLRAGSAAVDGRAFTVPGELPPSGDATAYRFQRPDRTYRAGLDAVWEHALGALREELPTDAAPVLAPYAVTRDRTRAVAGALGASPDTALAVLRAHGCVGCAMPLAVLAAEWERGGPTPGTPLASVAVGGGVSWAAWTWRT